MRKGLFLLGATAAVLSSCSNQEVVDMADYANQPIEFSTFVNNTTRADIEQGTFSKFWAFAQFHESTSSVDNDWANAFTGVQVNKTGSSAWVTEQTYYWSANDTYRFAAYSDGENSNAGVSYSAAGNGKLTFTNYTAGNNDLVAAFGEESGYTWNGEAGDNVPPVNLTFNHLLSKVTFTFKTNLSDNYTIQVSNLKVNAVKTTNGEYSKNGTLTWKTDADVTKSDYEFDDITDVASGTAGTDDFYSVTGAPLYLIPQANTSLNATFTVSLWDASQNPASDSPLAQNNFTAPLSYTAPQTSDGTMTGWWTPGFYYNYTGTITMDNIDPEGHQKPISFAVTAVNGWKDAQETTTTITPAD